MSDDIKFNYVTPEELSAWLEEKKPFFLIHALTGIHFQKVHLPGAQNACVFEVTFLDQMKSITADKNAEIVLYGSSERSMDALTAAEKLKFDGYRRVMILKGGIASWRALGYPLEGESAEIAGDPESRLLLPEGEYQIDTDQSIVEWVGRNPNTKHFGTVRISKGQIQIENGNMTGAVEIDMDSIENINLKGDELQPVLVSHLKSDDFFLVKLFPTAKFTINGGKIAEKPYLSLPNYEVDGILELRGVKADLSFLTTITHTDNNGLVAEAHFDIDRTLWNVIYGSSRFFEHLGMHLVFDLISFHLKIVARN
ncbi:MAG: YceI family protein [Deltaproteobacteria bacterium]|jgi:polyisoprenoid-binding protein YceI|nr:YceI family protein [Deltaproteobacteria bacterium]MBW2489222.1 YceI family protein [Deltaproteobacteria bacterium]